MYIILYTKAAKLASSTEISVLRKTVGKFPITEQWPDMS